MEVMNKHWNHQQVMNNTTFNTTPEATAFSFCRI